MPSSIVFFVSLLVLHCIVSASAEETKWSDLNAMERYMRECVELAKAAQAKGGAPYGAMIVDPTEGKVLVRGQNHAAVNPLWHGEMDAINRLATLASERNTTVYQWAPRLELYTSAEPCPMCMSAITWSSFGRVVFGSSIDFILRNGQDQIDIPSEEVRDRGHFHDKRLIRVVGGILKNETDPLYTTSEDASFGHQHRHRHDHNTGNCDCETSNM